MVGRASPTSRATPTTACRAVLLIMGLATANSLLTGAAPAVRRTRGPTRRHGGALLVEALYADQRGNLAALDADAMLSAHSFPLTPDELVAKAKDFIEADYGGADSSWLADNFVFVGPFIGPLTRQQYLDALGGNLNPSDGFPDLVGRQFGFNADPVEPGRVWWITRPVGTFSKPFFGAEPDGRKIETPPQAMGVVFNAAGKVAKINVGAVMDRTSGNTAGLGGLFGFLWFVGKAPPAPEYQPHSSTVKPGGH